MTTTSPFKLTEIKSCTCTNNALLVGTFAQPLFPSGVKCCNYDFKKFESPNYGSDLDCNVGKKNGIFPVLTGLPG